MSDFAVLDDHKWVKKGHDFCNKFGGKMKLFSIGNNMVLGWLVVLCCGRQSD